MSVKNQSKAAGRKAGAAPAARPEADGEDIARLLRALNDDLKLDPAEEYDPDTLDEEPEAKAERRMPVGMIAVALLAAMGIGFGVVMFDREQAAGPQTAPETAGAGMPATGPQPLIARTDLGPQAATTPKPAATAATPTPVLTPVPMPAQTPAPAANTPVAAVPAPAATPAAPAATAPIRIPEPPRLPEPAATPTTPPTTQATRQPAKPAAPPPAPAPMLSAPPAPPPVATATPGTAAPAPTAPKAVAPAKPMEAPTAALPPATPTAPAAPVPETTAPATPTATTEAGGKADAGALQAMLAPPEPVRPAPPPAAQPAAPARAMAGPVAGGRGRYAIQVGSFQLAENAEALVRRLQAGGLEAYALNWTDSAQRTWRVVRVGHYASSDEAQQAVGALLGNIGGLTPLVVGTR